jgi:hypothetical protein
MATANQNGGRIREADPRLPPDVDEGLPRREVNPFTSLIGAYACVPTK